MSILPKTNHFKNTLIIIGSVICAALIFVPITLQKLQINKLTTEVESIKSIDSNLSESLYNDHLYVMDTFKLKNQINALQEELDSLTSDEKIQFANQIQDIYTKLDDFESKVKRNSDVNLDIPNMDDIKDAWSNLLYEKDFDTLSTELENESKALDDSYNEYLASIKPKVSGGGEGYSYVTVNSEKGTFGVYLIKVPFSSVRVKTVSAHDGTCSDNCKTKSLADYVSENGGYAGMNGTYFCPPDYSSCSGKVNSFDYGLYDSNQNSWDNKDALGWSETGLVTFNGNTPSFYKKSTEYGGGSVSAGISNYPSLVKNGDVVVDKDDLTSFQKDIKGPRGAIGLGGENLYLAIVSNATVIDAAYVMKALGVKHALNLDGGGSSAMYINGGYVVGPGRSLPNAIVLIK